MPELRTGGTGDAVCRARHRAQQPDLECRTSATARVPKRKYFDGAGGHTVVEVVVNTAEMNASHATEAHILRMRSQAGVNRKEGEGAFQLFRYRAECKRTILGPPSRGIVYLRGSPPGDPDR